MITRKLWLLSILLLSLGLHGLGKKNPNPELAKFDEVDDDEKNVTAGTGGFFESETDDLDEYSPQDQGFETEVEGDDKNNDDEDEEDKWIEGNDKDLYEGDIMLNGVAPKEDDNDTENLATHNARIDGHWKEYGNAVIPYVISGTFTDEQMVTINNAFKEYHDKTCVKFVERDSSKHDYFIDIISNENDLGDAAEAGNCIQKSGCWSSVGFSKLDCNNDETKGVGQKLNLDNGCFYYRGELKGSAGTVIHEMMHAVGFWHEHSREDRDEVVTINYDRVASGRDHNFAKKNHLVANLIGKYDICSILHYRLRAFQKESIKESCKKEGKGSCRTISPKNEEDVEKCEGKVGKQQHLSVRDVEKINKYYGCSGEDYTTTSTASTTTAAESAGESTTTNYEGKDSDEITTESQSETTTSDDSEEKKTSTNPDDIYVEFRVKAEQNAHIVLAPCKDCDGIEIVLGFRGDTVTVMREKKKKPTVAVDENHPNILDPKVYKKFWIKTTTADDGKFTVDVGQGSEQTPLLSHTFDKEPNKINQIAFASRDKDKITIWGLADSKLHWPLFFRSKYKKYKYFPIPDVLGKYKMEMKKH